MKTHLSSSSTSRLFTLLFAADVSVCALPLSALALEKKSGEGAMLEEITVLGRSVSYANNATSPEMLKQQTSMTSVLAAIDNLPGVLINEGDTFGSDDWSTSISIRGFQVDLGQQQIGMTIDGIANGNSNYGGGAKANRYIDTENLRAVEVSQGTADIASRSNEALGGTLNFTTIDPGMEKTMIASATLGEFGAQKVYLRYETGEILKDTYAWFSLSAQENSDWMDQVAENARDHFAAKFISNVGGVDLTGYVAYDDTHEDNYQRIYSLEQFAQNPKWDQLTSDWSGIPYQDQAYRRGWSTLRENLFAYLQANFAVGEVDFSANVYYHDNEGRGDWVPPYLVNVTDDGAGNPHSELIPGNTAFGGAFLGRIYFVDPNGAQLSPIAGCQSSLTFPYGGAGPEYDPSCHERDAVPVGSYRHTHYEKQRLGFNADFTWMTQIGALDNTVRGGFWYEDYERDEQRDWHKIIDSATGFRFEHRPYWVQYDRSFPVKTLMYYLEGELDAGFAKFRVGAKQFNVDVKKRDNFTAANNLGVSSDSDTLLTAGFVAPLPVDGMEIFGGYAQNFAAIKDAILERDDADLRRVKPEQADNIDFGLRYSSANFNANLTYYTIEFDNRITFISNEEVTGIDFLEAAAGGYINEGGVQSDGIEASIQYQATEALSIFASFTSNNSQYTDANIAGNTVIGAAEDMAVLSFDYVSNLYSMGLSAKYVGDRFIDQANTRTVNSYVVSDLYIGASIEGMGWGALDLRLTVNNLLDKSYAGTIAPNAFWIGAPRTVAINAQLRF